MIIDYEKIVDQFENKHPRPGEIFGSNRGVAIDVAKEACKQLGHQISEIANQDGDDASDGEVVDEVINLLKEKIKYINIDESSLHQR